jgi:hypothetical protein
MPDVREVYEMVTKQKPSDPWALERQHTRQIRTMRNRKVGAFAVVAAIVVAAVAVILATHPGENQTNTGTQRTATPVEVATGFVEAYGAHDADRAIAYLSDDADISGLIDSIGARGIEDSPADLPILFSWLDATGNKVTLDACQETTPGPVSGTAVRCTYDFYGLRADEIGLGPYRGSYFDLTVGDDGHITRASQYWETEKFSRQMWGPFERWVSHCCPEHVAYMYTDETHSGPLLTDGSIRRWEVYTQRYVSETNA